MLIIFDIIMCTWRCITFCNRWVVILATSFGSVVACWDGDVRHSYVTYKWFTNTQYTVAYTFTCSVFYTLRFLDFFNMFHSVRRRHFIKLRCINPAHLLDQTVEQLVRNLHNRIHVPFSSSEVYPVWTDLIWPGLWAANFGESLTVFQDTQHAERTRGDLKRRESGLRSAMGIAVAHDGTRSICHRLIRGRTDNNEAK